MKILDYLHLEYDSEIVDEFLEHFDIINDTLDLIITNLNNQNYCESINEIFRVFHNLKSAAGYLHLKRMHLFTEFVEDILEKARNQCTFTEEFRDWLYLCASQLDLWHDDVVKNHKELSPIKKEILIIPKGF
jgi:two-component system chemotaxis sensor kinase CheA